MGETDGTNVANEGKKGAAAIVRDRKEASRRAFDAQAATYDEDMNGEHARRLYPLVLERIVAAAPADVLDLGCGTGALAQLVLDAVSGCALEGVDLSEEMAARARERLGDRAEVRLADSEHLPFGDESFDLVYCNDSFHHYPDPRRAAFEVWRVLQPGGLFVMGDCWAPAPVRAVMNAFIPYSNEGDVRIYSERELRDILGTWFARVAWKRVGPSACLAVAEK